MVPSMEPKIKAWHGSKLYDGLVSCSAFAFFYVLLCLSMQYILYVIDSTQEWPSNYHHTVEQEFTDSAFTL
ncbi:hypothetical protein CISIN_1g047349mg [Citrus sinensis]|uniref:Uncharacterized protein n=1 Tax=Citrus sinensis TaxID=2711 RepID=A0A067EBI4_CITSI|nr:hypothetical protein CISIN_1g047349mg [Citrus sinensis]